MRGETLSSVVLQCIAECAPVHNMEEVWAELGPETQDNLEVS